MTGINEITNSRGTSIKTRIETTLGINVARAYLKFERHIH